MGEYEIDWNADEMIVDGHKCKKVEDGVYEVEDKYCVDPAKWMFDVRNAGLHAVCLQHRACEKRIIKYVCCEEHKIIEAAMNHIPKDKAIQEMFCYHTGMDTKLTFDQSGNLYLN